MSEISEKTLENFRRRFDMPGLTAEDFKRGIKNPIFPKMHTKMELWVNNEALEVYKKISEKNGTDLERLMREALTNYAKQLEEAE
jgi:hypothetical protein